MLLRLSDRLVPRARFGALLFFLDFNMAQQADRVERLAIFGPMRNRRGTELKASGRRQGAHGDTQEQVPRLLLASRKNAYVLSSRIFICIDRACRFLIDGARMGTRARRFQR